MKIGNFIQNNFGDSYLYEVNHGAFNQVGAKAFYDQFFAKHFSQDEQLYLIVGSDSGLLPKYIATHHYQKNSRYIIIEVPQVLEKLKTDPEWEALKSQFIFVRPEQWHETADNNQLWSYLAVQRVKILSSVAALDDYLNVYHAITQEIEQQIDQEGWHARVHFAGHTFTTIQVRNVAENHTPADCLKSVAMGKKGILLAGGPSLDLALPIIQQFREKLFIVAVSRISARLLDVGITPDIVVCIDPTEKMFTVSKEALQFEPAPLLVQAYCATSLLTGVWPGPQVYLGQRFPWDTSLNVDNIPMVGPTVTNAALQVMMIMGFSKIYLVGVDLSYSIEGYSHAKGSAEYKAGPKLDFIGQRVDLYDGTEGETDNAFAQAINTLSEQAVRAQEIGCAIVNVSGTAAKVVGIAHEPLSGDIVEENIESVKLAIKDKLLINDKDYLVNYYQDALQELTKTKKNLFQFKQLVQEGLNLCQQHKKTNNPAIYNKLNKLDEKINKDQFHVLATVKTHGYRYLEDVFKHAAKKNVTDDVMKVTLSYLQGYYKSTEELIAMIMEAIDRLQAREYELSEQPNCQAIIDQWQKDRHYFCAKSFLDKCSAKLSFKEKFSLKKLIKTAKDFVPKEAINKIQSWDNLQYQKAVLRKLEYLFKQEDVARLDYMVHHLAIRKEDAAILACHFSKGLIAELNKDWEEAVENFHIAAKDIFIETALNHLAIVLINKRDLQNALFALDCLVKLSPGYVPQYHQLKQLIDEQSLSSNH